MEQLKNILAVLGGITLVLTAIAAFSGHLIRDFLKQRWKTKNDVQMEEVRARGKIQNIQPEHYAIDQYDVYKKLSGALGKLKTDVDALWESATNENIFSLAQQLRTVQDSIQSWNMFFDPEHLTQLQSALAVLGGFHSGKVDLYNLRYFQQLLYDDDSRYEDTIKKQIARNGRYRQEFNRLLEQIIQSFREKLSGGERP